MPRPASCRARLRSAASVRHRTHRSSEGDKRSDETRWPAGGEPASGFCFLRLCSLASHQRLGNRMNRNDPIPRVVGTRSRPAAGCH